MAKKENKADFRSIISSIKKKDFAPVYILMGEESFYIDLITEQLEECVLPANEKDFNFNLFYGHDADIKTVMSAAQQFPVMADRKLVILKEGQTLYKAKEALDQIAPYVARPNPSTVLAIIYKGGSLSATSKLLKAASASNAIVFNMPAVRDYQMASHIKDYCMYNKIELEEKAMTLMIDYIGLPLSKFFGELQKLVSIKKNKNKESGVIRITAEDVEKNIGISKDFNNFELTKALSIKDYPRCVRILNYFEKNPKANPGIVVGAAIASFFTKLILAHYSDKSESSLQQIIGYPNMSALRELRDAMHSFTAMQAVNGLHYVREFDAKSKGIGSMQNEYLLLKELIFKIFTT